MWHSRCDQSFCKEDGREAAIAKDSDFLLIEHRDLVTQREGIAGLIGSQFKDASRPLCLGWRDFNFRMIVECFEEHRFVPDVRQFGCFEGALGGIELLVS